MKIIKRIQEWYQNLIEEITHNFTSEPYERGLGKSDRFPSLMSLVIRFILKYLHIILLLALVATMIVGFIIGEIPVIGVVIVSPIAVALFCVAAVLIFTIFCIVESFAKILASLIQYNEMPTGAENPADAVLMRIARACIASGKKERKNKK